VYILLVVFPSHTLTHNLSLSLSLWHFLFLSIIYAFTTRPTITYTYAAANVNCVNDSDVDVLTRRRLDVLSIADGLSGAHPKRFTVICIILVLPPSLVQSTILVFGIGKRWYNFRIVCSIMIRCFTADTSIVL